MKILVTRGPVVDEYLRFDDDTVYDVEPGQAQRFIALGWAEPAPKNAKAAKPFNIKNITDEEAEAWRADKEARLERARQKMVAATAPVDLDVQDMESGSETEM